MKQRKKSPITWQEQMEFIRDHAKFEDLRYEPAKSQLKALWISFCLYWDCEVDTAEYDNLVLFLWEQGVSQNESNQWKDFNAFDNFMCGELV